MTPRTMAMDLKIASHTLAYFPKFCRSKFHLFQIPLVAQRSAPVASTPLSALTGATFRHSQTVEFEGCSHGQGFQITNQFQALCPWCCWWSVLPVP